MCRPGFVAEVVRRARARGVLVIFDEVMTGFGRTGSLFACLGVGVTPDLVCLSKGLTGGFLPLSAVLTSEDVYAAFYDDYTTLRAFLHSHSYTGNPLACAAALATLDLFAASDVLEKNRVRAAALRAGVATLEDHPHVAEIRQTGMILAMEMVRDARTREPYPWQERRGLKVYQHALGKGVLLRPLAHVVYFMPPYVIEDDEIALLAQTAIEGIDVATREA